MNVNVSAGNHGHSAYMRDGANEMPDDNEMRAYGRRYGCLDVALCLLGMSKTAFRMRTSK